MKVKNNKESKDQSFTLTVVYVSDTVKITEQTI